MRSAARSRRSTALVLLAAALTTDTAADTAVTNPYTGSAECGACHQAEYTAWKASHHYQAMRPATEESVRGDFDDTTYRYGDVTSRFFRQDGKLMVETDGPDGALRRYEVVYTFGFQPLQQYLVAFPDGRYQALNVVWDSRPGAAGGQRWVHLYPEAEGSPVTHADRLHWTGAFQNWNSRCAVCHSTGLEKNYSAGTDRYRTEWQEINVACEACHGPGGDHVEWARAAAGGDAPDAGPHRGFAFSLADRGAFGPPETEGSRSLQRQDGTHPTAQLETCAACHSRRSEIAPYAAGPGFADRYRLALVEPGLYFPDGQVRDEVYVYGSFLQSKMHAGGVVCTNCHEPHSNRLLAEGNALCTQCHAAAAFDTPEHHHHLAGSTGAACVECHMPVRTYMVVDDRRDHSFRVPEPLLAEQVGAPDACTSCHTDRDAAWAARALAGWGVSEGIRADHAPLFEQAWSGNAAALPGLLELAADPARPAILRASAALASGTFPSRETLQGIGSLVFDDDPLVRAAAVRSLHWLPTEQRYRLLQRLVADPVKSVRMAVAQQLAAVPPETQSPGEGRALASLNAEYLATLQLNADFPEEQMNLGLYRMAKGDAAAAEQAYRKALKLSPAYAPALLNLADLYRTTGLDAQARPLLERAIAAEPDAAAPQYALGLLLVRQKQLAEALPRLERAARLEPQNPRYAYVLAVAQWESGRREQALATLEKAAARHPGHPDITHALNSYRDQRP